MIGRTLTHYKVIAELGSGGMGVVYKALDLRLDRHVALKILPPDKSNDAERRSRFLHEARAASALNDPHIVTIFDIFTEDGTDVLVMEFVQGRTLREILDDGPMPAARALDIALQVAEGVGTAHTAGIVHRDLKPGNVMVTDRGRVKVLDFGLAKLVGAGSIADQPTIAAPTTVAGMLLGTVDYMSPEQAKGEAIDARSDVFSLGAMLYEMLTGARPFVAGHMLGVLHEILYSTVAPPRSKRPEISPQLERTVLRALERDLTRRYPSMESFAADLRRAHRDAEGETRDRTVPASPLPVMPPPLPYESSRPPAVAERVAAPPKVAATSATPAASHPASPAHASPPTRTRDRTKTGRRSRFRKVVLVVVVLMSINWVRELTKPPRAERRPPVAGSNRAGQGDRFATAVEDAVAGALDRFGPNSASIQLARGGIYWKRAQKNGDAALMKKAEDTFNDVLRLNPDPDEEAEAREALRQIAAAKAASAR